jgi:hypothetical protein
MQKRETLTQKTTPKEMRRWFADVPARTKRGSCGDGKGSEVVRHRLRLLLAHSPTGCINYHMMPLRILLLFLSLGCAAAEVPQDAVGAAKWYRKSAEQGNAETQYELGDCYREGKGVPQDAVEAVKWFRKSAEQGNMSGQCALGHAYDTGEGVPQDDAEAVRWYRKSAEQGNAKAQYNLGLSMAKGKGVPQNAVEAAKWYRKSAEQGNMGGQCALGLAYSRGQGVGHDFVKGYFWLNLASAQGDAIAKESKEIIIRAMTRKQIAEAQKLSREWMEKREKKE